MQSLFQKYRHALWFLLFGALSAFYFVSQHLGLRSPAGGIAAVDHENSHAYQYQCR